VSLRGSGLIHNASACHIASQEIRTSPVLSKTAELPLDAPQLFLPDRVPAVASHELAKIEAAMSPETSGLNYVKERLVTPRQAFDVDTLLHVHQKSVHATRESHWLRLTTITACSITIVLLLFSSFRSHFRNLFLRCWQVKADPSPIAAPRAAPVPTPYSSTWELGLETWVPKNQSFSPPMLYRTLNAEYRYEVITTWSHARWLIMSTHLAARPKRLTQQHSIDALNYAIQNFKY